METDSDLSDITLSNVTDQLVRRKNFVNNIFLSGPSQTFRHTMASSA